MSRYYFHVVNGEFVPDQHGQECATPDEVKALAAKTAGALIRDQGLQMWKTGSWSMFVCDANNHTLLKLTFEAEDLTGALSDGKTH